MSMVESAGAASVGGQGAGLPGWLKALLRMFGIGTASAAPSAPAVSQEVAEAAEEAEGAYVVAPGGYRIRVPHPSDVGQSVGELLPTVRQGLNLLPPLPTVVIELLKEIQDAKSTAASVAEVASSDPALAASLLRTANGAAMGLSRTITSVSEAVSYLGFGTVKAMVIRLRLNEVLACKNEQAARDSEDLWVHSLAVSYAAEYLAKRIGGLDHGFVATLGLLHDIGKLAVLAQLPEATASLRNERASDAVSRLEIEARVLGMDHAGLGANLAAKWKLPADLVQAIRCHHLPAGSLLPSDPLPLRKAVLVLQIANQLAKYCYAHADQMEIETVPDEAFVMLGLEPSLPKLLNGGVREAIGRAIFFATANSHRPATAPGRFLRPLAGPEAAALLAASSAMEPRVAVDEALIASVFAPTATEVIIQGDTQPNLVGVTHARFVASASPASIERCILSAVAHEEEMGIRLDQRSAAALVLRSMLPNLVTLSNKGEPIEWVQGKVNGRLMLGVRSPALKVSRRTTAPATANAARQLAEADLASLLNLGWYDRIAVSEDGSTIALIVA